MTGRDRFLTVRTLTGCAPTREYWKIDHGIGLPAFRNFSVLHMRILLNVWKKMQSWMSNEPFVNVLHWCLIGLHTVVWYLHIAPRTKFGSTTQRWRVSYSYSIELARLFVGRARDPAYIMLWPLPTEVADLVRVESVEPETLTFRPVWSSPMLGASVAEKLPHQIHMKYRIRYSSSMGRSPVLY